MVFKFTFTKHDEYIDSSSAILEDIKGLFLNSKYADVTFIIGKRRFPVHKTILITRVQYFRAMFCGEFSEANKNEIELHVSPGGFLLILQFIYIGNFKMHLLKKEDIINALEIAREYCFEEFTYYFCEFLSNYLFYPYLSLVISVARQFKRSLGYDEKIRKLCANENDTLFGFRLLEKDVVVDILSSDYLNADELSIFQGVLRCRKTHTEEEFKELISHVRFHLFTTSQLRIYVPPTGILTYTEVEEVIKEIKTLERLPYRCNELQPQEDRGISIMEDLNESCRSFWDKYGSVVIFFFHVVSYCLLYILVAHLYETESFVTFLVLIFIFYLCGRYDCIYFSFALVIKHHDKNNNKTKSISRKRY